SSRHWRPRRALLKQLGAGRKRSQFGKLSFRTPRSGGPESSSGFRVRSLRSRPGMTRLSPRLNEADRFVLLEQIQQVAQRPAARRLEHRVAGENERRIIARGAEVFAVKFRQREVKAGHAALASAEQIAFAAQP